MLYPVGKIGGMEINSAVERSNRKSQNYPKCCANGCNKPSKRQKLCFCRLVDVMGAVRNFTSLETVSLGSK